MSFVYYIWYIKISKNVLTFLIYVHVCTIKYDQMKECSALMMNSKQRFFFQMIQKNLCALHILLIKIIILNL